MAIQVPGKRFGKRLAHSRVFGHGMHGGHKAMNADLNVTPLVDMFVILVLFLVANFSNGEVLMMTKDINLPEASNTDELVLAPVVMVSKTEVLVSGALVGRVDDLTREEYLNIPALEEKLRDMKKQFEDLHNAAQDLNAFKGDVNIQADKSAQFKIIKRVMFSCASAGYGNISFATMAASSGKKEGGESASRD
jgi:biopolymer transport protein ExbD